MADPRTEGRRRNRRRVNRAFILDGTHGIFDRLEPRLLLATDVWTGAVDGNWSTAGNWLSGSAPSAGDNLDFPSVASNLTNTNDFAANTLFNTITIDASGYNLGGNAIDLGGGISATYGSGTSTISTDLALQSSQTVDVASGGALDLSGVISGSGYGITAGGAGTLQLTTSYGETYTGTTTVNAGELDLNGSGGSGMLQGPLVINGTSGSALVKDLAADQVDNQAVTLDGSGATWNLNNFSDNVGLLTFTGGTVESGTGQLNPQNSIVTNAATTTAVISGNLDIHAVDPVIFTIAQGTVPSGGPDLNVSAVIWGGGFTRSVSKGGAGTLELSGVNTYTGPTTVSAGTLLAENNAALGTTAAGTTVDSGATLALAGGISTAEAVTVSGTGVGGNGAIVNVSGSNTLSGAVTLNADSSIGVTAGALTISGAIGGSYALTQVGSGTLALWANPNTYNGGTTLDGGTLLIDGLIAGNVAVNAGTIGGTGTIGGSAVTMTGGTLAPGTIGGFGILSMSRAATVYTFASSSTYQVALDGAYAYSAINFNGNSGTPTVNLNGAALDVTLGYLPSVGDSFPIVATYGPGPSLTTTGTFNGLADGATLDATYNGADVTLQIHYEADSIVLSVTGVTYTWSGLGGDDNWSTGANWVGGTAPTPAAGTSLLFPAGAAQPTNNDDLTNGSAFDNITINASGYNIGGNSIDLNGDITAGFALGTSIIADDLALQSSRTITVSSGGTLDLSGAISGTNYGLTMTGGGTLEFAGSTANTYTGTTTVNDGTLELDKGGSDFAIAGDLVVGDNTDPATVQYDAINQIADTSTVTLNEGANFDLDGYTEVIGTLDMTGATVMMTTGLLVVADGITTSNTTVPPDVESTIQGGTLDLDSNATFPLTVARDLNLRTDLSITSIIADGGIAKDGAGVAYFSGANTYGGGTTVNAGAMGVGNDTALGAAGGTTTVASGASVVFEAPTLAVDEAFTITGSGASSEGALWVASGDTTLSGGVTLTGTAQLGAATGSTLTISGVVSGGQPATLDVTNGATGITVLSGDNTYSGPTSANLGYLEATSDNAFGDPTASATVTIENGASLELSGGISTPASKTLIVAGTGANSGAADPILNLAGDNTFGGPIQIQANTSVSAATGTTLTLSGDISESSPPCNLSKDGAGTLVLSGTGSYTGDTNINAGRLQVDGDISASDVVYVNPGATLDGTGTVPSPSVGGTGTIAPGDGGPGILNTGVLGLSPSSIASFVLDGPTAGSGYSQFVVSGTSSVVIDSATLSLDLVYTPAIGTQFTLISNNTGQSLIGAFDGLANNQTFTQGNVTFQISYTGGTGGNSVVLTVTDVPYTWSGLGGDKNWSTAANWVGDVVPTPGARLIFPDGAARLTSNDDLGAGFAVNAIDIGGTGYAITGNAIDLGAGVATTYGSGTSTVSDPLALQANVTTDVATGGMLVLSGAISGAADGDGLTKTGTGTLQFGGTSANTYTGTTYVDAGTLQLDHPASVLAVPGNLVVGDNVGTGAAVEIMVNDQIANNANVTVNQAATLSVDTGVAEQFMVLTLQDATVDLASGASLNPMSGLNVNAGSDHIGSLIQGAGVFVLQGTLTINVADDPNVPVDLRVSAAMGNPTGGSGALAKTGAGTMALSGDNTFGGSVNVDVGTIQDESSTALGSGGTITVAGGASVAFAGSSLTVANPFSIAGAGVNSLGALWVASGDAAITGGVTMTGASQIGAAVGSSLTVSGAISGSYNLTIANGATGTTILSGDNTYGGDTDVNSGYLQVASDNALGGPTSNSGINVGAGASLELSGGITIPATKYPYLTGSGAGGTADKVINLSGDNTYAADVTLEVGESFNVAMGTSLTLQGAIDQYVTSDLTKDGGGTLVLSGTGSYTGPTVVNAGTLEVDGTISASSGLTVASGATLAGAGTAPAVTASSGGTVAPGIAGAAGALATGNLGLDSGSTYQVVLGGIVAGTDYTQLNVNGAVSLGGATLSVNIGGDFQAASGDAFTLISNDGVDPVTGTFAGLPEGTIFAVAGQVFQISYAGGTGGNSVTLTAVPIVVTPATLPSPAVGTTYSQQLTGSGGSGGGYTYSATGLPTGLSIGASGLISGILTTTTGSPFSVDVTITDGDGNARTVPYTLSAVAGASTTTLASSANPATVGQPVVLTATVSATQVGSVFPNGGTVTFYDGATVLGTAPVVDGTAQWVVTSLSAGSHSPTAAFSGNTDFLASTSSALDQTSRYATAATFTVAGTGSTASPPIMLTFSVPGQGDQFATGTVQFFDGSTPIGTATLDANGTATFTDIEIAAGSHTFIATYAGDALFTGSTSTQSFAVGKAPSQTGDVASSAPQVYYGQQVTLTATFTASYNGSTPMTGTVAFYDGTTFLGTADLSSLPPTAPTAAPAGSPVIHPALPSPTQITGQAVLLSVTLTVGDHNIMAIYSGDPDYAGVTSVTPVSVAVQQATTATQLAMGAGAAGATILTATIVPTSPGTPILTGTVAFYDGTTLLGTAPVINQVATLNAGVLSVGSHTFRAVFSGGAEATSSGSTNVIDTPAGNGPVVVSIRRYGRLFQPTYVVLGFNGALDLASAQDVRNYRLQRLNRHGRPMGGPVVIKRAQFDPTTNTVTLSFAHRLSRYRNFRVTVLGSSTSGVTGVTGQPLNASTQQTAGGNYTGRMTWKDYAGSSNRLPVAGSAS